MKKNILKYITIITFTVLGATAFAQSEDVFSAFKNFKDIPAVEIKVPTVVEVPFEGEYVGRQYFAVYEKETESFVPSFFNVKNKKELISFVVSSNITNSQDRNLIDKRYDTFADYPLPETYRGSVELAIVAMEPVTASSLNVFLANNVALPTSVEVRVGSGSESSIVLAKTRMRSSRVAFPETTAKKWTVKMEYSQPLRIAELSLGQKASKTTTERLRFLVQPGNTYRVYYNPDRTVRLSMGETPNLRDDKGVILLDSSAGQENPVYIQADIDKDGIPDVTDNCVSVTNSGQEDVDGNKRGDACDDFDRDGVMNSKDNCVNKPNTRQADIDGDGIGDVCDGEESRVTEKYGWLPWLGMGIAVLVVFALFYFTMRGGVKKEEDAPEDSNENTPPAPPSQ